jgi:ferredoxin
VVYKIGENCISCGACESECPNNAISEGPDTFVIDPAKCTECVGAYESSRCARICPLKVCTRDDSSTESHEQLLEKWLKLHPGEIPKMA